VSVTSTSGSSTTGTETEVSTASTVASDDSQTAELHSKGKDMVAELQKEHKSTKTDTERQKVCEVHKQGLTNKFTVITRNSQSYQTRIDDVYTKALAFQTSKSISSTDLTALIATADAAKLTSATSIANLKALAPTINFDQRQRRPRRRHLQGGYHPNPHRPQGLQNGRQSRRPKPVGVHQDDNRHFH